MIGGGVVTISPATISYYMGTLSHPTGATPLVKMRRRERHMYLLNRAIYLWQESDRPDINVNTEARVNELLEILDDPTVNIDEPNDTPSSESDHGSDDGSTDEEHGVGLVQGLPVGSGYGGNVSDSSDDEIERIQLPAHPITHFGYARSF